ncbi:MAG: class I cytochrome c [Gammaproteobacteria bacterium]|nr:MAG: class I cytochrome c [Gammaproteobacteria bacterium]
MPDGPSQQEAEKQGGSPEIIRLLRKNDCFKCHTVDRDKDGPSYQSVAEKYKDHPDPRESLFEHLTSSPTITVNRKEEAHVSFKTTDTQEIMNVVDWILSN